MYQLQGTSLLPRGYDFSQTYRSERIARLALRRIYRLLQRTDAGYTLIFDEADGSLTELDHDRPIYVYRVIA